MSPVWSADWLEVDVWLRVLDTFLHLLCLCRTFFFVSGTLISHVCSDATAFTTTKLPLQAQNMKTSNRKDKLKKNSNSARLKWQIWRFLLIKQTLQSTRGGNWRQSNLTGLSHHVKSLFGLNVFPFVWLCKFVILSFRSLPPSFLCENTCLLPVLLMLFTWTVVNHQGRLEMHARICTGSPKNTIRGFPPAVAGLCLYSLPTSAAEMIIFTRNSVGHIEPQILTLENRINLKNIPETSSNWKRKWKQMCAGGCVVSVLGCWSMLCEISVTLTIVIWCWSSVTKPTWERTVRHT